MAQKSNTLLGRNSGPAPPSAIAESERNVSLTTPLIDYLRVTALLGALWTPQRLNGIAWNRNGLPESRLLDHPCLDGASEPSHSDVSGSKTIPFTGSDGLHESDVGATGSAAQRHNKGNALPVQSKGQNSRASWPSSCFSFSDFPTLTPVRQPAYCFTPLPPRRLVPRPWLTLAHP